MNTSPLELRPQGPWVAVYCSTTAEVFGGLYSTAEAAHMERATAGHQPLTPAQFGQIAAEAVNQCKILRAD